MTRLPLPDLEGPSRRGTRRPGWGARGPLGRTTFLPAGRRAKYAVVLFWLVIVAAAVPLALRLGEVQRNDTLDALPTDAEASRAAARLAAGSPHPDALVAVVVYARDTQLVDADRSKVDDDRAAFARYAEGGTVPAPVPAADGRALLLSFP